MDKRLGQKNTQGEIILAPEQTLSGGELPPKPHSTIGLGNGYFAVLDAFLKDEKRNLYILELQKIISSTPAPKAVTTTKATE